MTLLIFKTAERVIATTAWTAETSATVPDMIKVTFVGDHKPGSPHQRVHFAMPMKKFLGEMIYGTIDLREWQEQEQPHDR